MNCGCALLNSISSIISFLQPESSSSSVVWSTLCVTRASWQSAGLLGGLSRAGASSTSNNANSNEGTTVGSSAESIQAEAEDLKRLSRSLGLEGNLSTTSADPSSILSVSQSHNLSVGGAELLNLLPGFYELQIMAVSLAGNSSWTPPVLFEVTASPIGKSALLVIMLSLLPCLGFSPAQFSKLLKGLRYEGDFVLI